MFDESNFRIAACWSKAGVGTSIVLESKDECGQQKTNRGTKIALDLGSTPIFDQTIQANTVLISHGHIDHIGGVFSHARAHRLLSGGNSTPTYYVPQELVGRLEEAKKAVAALDAANDGTGSRMGGMLEMQIIGVKPGDQIMLPIKRRINGTVTFARVFPVSHDGCPAVGYIIGSRYKPTLKPEYVGKPSREIGELVKSGVQIRNEPKECLDVAYTGDTAIDGLLNNDPCVQQIFDCPLIICEATMLEDSDQAKELACKRGHMHVQDIARLMTEKVHGDRSRQEWVLVHISARYDAATALRYAASAIPEKFRGNVWVSITALPEREQFSNVVESGMVKLSTYVS